MICPLCSHNAELFSEDKKRKFYRCPECRGIFADSDSLPSPKEEEERYHLHNYDEQDAGYLKFITPLIEAIKGNQKNTDKGLDYGCGKVPILANHLMELGFQMALYDPFFHKNSSIFNQKYDFIVCCEVIEHFHKPNEQFQILKSLLSNSGSLYCKTELQPDLIDFQSWWYKNDITHTFFYSEETLQWIKEEFDFREVVVAPNYILLLR